MIMFSPVCFDIFEDQRLKDKVEEVVLSCETLDQFKTSQAYIRLAIKRAKLRFTADYLEQMNNKVHRLIKKLKDNKCSKTSVIG